MLGAIATAFFALPGSTSNPKNDFASEPRINDRGAFTRWRRLKPTLLKIDTRQKRYKKPYLQPLRATPRQMN